MQESRLVAPTAPEEGSGVQGGPLELNSFSEVTSQFLGQVGWWHHGNPRLLLRAIN